MIIFYIYIILLTDENQTVLLSSKKEGLSKRTFNITQAVVSYNVNDLLIP